MTTISLHVTRMSATKALPAWADDASPKRTQSSNVVLRAWRMAQAVFGAAGRNGDKDAWQAPGRRPRRDLNIARPDRREPRWPQIAVEKDGDAAEHREGVTGATASEGGVHQEDGRLPRQRIPLKLGRDNCEVLLPAAPLQARGGGGAKLQWPTNA